MPDRETMLIACARLELVDAKSAEIGRRCDPPLAPETVRAVLKGERASARSRKAVLRVLGLAA